MRLSYMHMRSQATFPVRGDCAQAGPARLAARRGDLGRLSPAGLEARQGAWKQRGKPLPAWAQMTSLPAIRQADPEGFGTLDVTLGRGPLQWLDRALHALFRRGSGEQPGFPRSRARTRSPCLDVLTPRPGRGTIRPGVAVVKGKGRPKLKLRPTRPLPDSPPLKRVRLVRRPPGVTVTLVDAVASPPLPVCPRAGGLALGVHQRLTLSNGETIDRARRDDAAIATQQQQVSRCQPGSPIRRKQVRQLARRRRRQHIRNRTACHRLTTALVHRFGLIAVAAWHLPNMTRSAKGTLEQPGTNVAQKTGLNQAITE